MSLTNLTTGARVAPALPPALRLAPYTSPSPISTGPSPTAIAADAGFAVRDPWELAVRFEVAS